MTKINFESEGVEMPALDFDRVRRWIKKVAEAHGFGVSRISYLFCNDDHILEVNRKFIDHDYYTDIITFDYSSATCICGDIVISLDTVASNAAQGIGDDYERELHRVIIHGVLHLCGVNDKGPGEREIMEAEENKALELLQTLEVK